MFTAEQYVKALEGLINKMGRAPEEIVGPHVQDAMKDICALLNIGKVRASLYETPWHEKMKYGDTVVLYDTETFDNDRSISKHEMIGSGGTVNYQYFQVQGGADWTQQELEKIDTLHQLVFAFNGRARLMLIAEKLRYNDTELGMRNLAFFLKTTGYLIENKQIEEYAVCYFNIKRLSIFNSQLGREGGTAIMRMFINGLQDILSKKECVCRIGGDNFITLFHKEKIHSVIDYLSGTEITEPMHKKRYLVSASQGYYMIKADECYQPADIVDKVSIAANIAQKSPEEPYVFYDDGIRRNELYIKEIEDMFHSAIENEEFLVFYQPKVKLQDYSLTGAEALCRWFHNGEIIQPTKFIPVLERSRLICDLDFYMLEHICMDIRKWIDEGRNVVKVSVNLSRVHLGDSNLLEHVMGIIDKYNVPHNYIEIELTETTTDVDYTELKKVVNGFMEAGIYTSVDDFGIGYSSLNLIRELPWNVLKIDKSFLPDGGSNDDQAKTMLKDVVGMANDLGLQCIVEGVETPDQVMLLKENNCFLAQGFYFDKPLPVEEFEKRLDGKHD